MGNVEDSQLIQYKLQEIKRALEFLTYQIVEIDKIITTLSAMKSNDLKNVLIQSSGILIFAERINSDIILVDFGNGYYGEMNAQEAIDYFNKIRESIKQDYEKLNLELKSYEKKIIEMIKQWYLRV